MTEWHLARGYRYAGINSGVRPERSRRDLALIVSTTTTGGLTAANFIF